MAWEQARDIYVRPWCLQEKPLYIDPVPCSKYSNPPDRKQVHVVTHYVRVVCCVVYSVVAQD